MLMSMQDYQVLWYVLVGLVLFLFALTAGADLGIGMLLPWLGRDNIQRRMIINAIGPTWDGNQVWLIIAGGALFVIWPYAYALAFSGFYGGMLLMLWALFLRPVGFEWRNKIKKAGWMRFWDSGLFLGSLIPSFVIGLLLGNLMRGVPFSYDASYRVLESGTLWQLFNPFSILVGFVSVFMLLMHGSRYLKLRTTGEVERRCGTVNWVAGIVFLALFILAGIWIYRGLMGYQIVTPARVDNFLAGQVKQVPSALLLNYKHHPWMMLAPLCAIVFSLICIVTSHAKRIAGESFWSSAIASLATIFTFGFSQFPFIVPSSSQPNQSLTVWNASASHYTLQTIFIVAVIMLPTIGVYTIWVFRKIWGKMTPESIEQDTHELY